jgi:hypothetical protein
MCKQALYDWMVAQHRPIKTSEVIRWGSDHFSNRADRNARQLANDGKIERLSDTEKQQLFGNIKEDVWRVVTKEPTQMSMGLPVNYYEYRS